MAGSRSHSRNASQARAGDEDSSVLGAVIDVGNKQSQCHAVNADHKLDASTRSLWAQDDGDRKSLDGRGVASVVKCHEQHITVNA